VHKYLKVTRVFKRNGFSEKREEKGYVEMKRTLALYPFNQKFPTIYEPTIEFLSKRYKLNYSPSPWSKFYKLKDIKIVRNTYYFVMKILRKYLIKNKIKVNPKESLLYCFNQLPPEQFDFIIDLETVIGLSDYDYAKLNKKYISDRMASEKCKAILCWNKIAYDELVSTIDCSRFKKKINIVDFGGEDFKFKEIDKKTLNFLFVSSINNPNSFETKGGLIALEAYSQLAKKYKNIKFFVRANINKKFIEEYNKTPGLIFLTKYLPNTEMEKLFLHSDILLVPIPGIDLFIKSMRFGIPAISFDYGVADEMIINKKTGFLIDSSKIFTSKKNLEEHYKNQSKDYKSLSNKEFCLKFVPEFVEKSEILIKNKEILKKMKKNQHSLVGKNGKYSLENRKNKLIKLIDPHIK